jgi:hypothetical protein
MKELEKEAQDWLAKHAVLLGPEELPFEEERLDEAMRTRDGEWPVPCVVPHMGVFADIKDEESFNRIVGEPDNWSIILGRSDLYHAWIVPQAIIIFGKVWFNRKQWGDSMRPGPPPSLFGSNDRRAAREAGTTMPRRQLVVQLSCESYLVLSMLWISIYLEAGEPSREASRNPVDTLSAQ